VRQRLTCVECGREHDADGRGWKAYLTTGEDEPAEAVVYCPECAAREFGARASSGGKHQPAPSVA
jgi:DNA-directed RNA polymerase subunit RPC12/RpoP